MNEQIELIKKIKSTPKPWWYNCALILEYHNLMAEKNPWWNINNTAITLEMSREWIGQKLYLARKLKGIPGLELVKNQRQAIKLLKNPSIHYNLDKYLKEVGLNKRIQRILGLNNKELKSFKRSRRLGVIDAR